jgi:hypothetical protein
MLFHLIWAVLKVIKIDVTLCNNMQFCILLQISYFMGNKEYSAAAKAMSEAAAKHFATGCRKQSGSNMERKNPFCAGYS